MSAKVTYFLKLKAICAKKIKKRTTKNEFKTRFL